jgi:hypothetical protein
MWFVPRSHLEDNWGYQVSSVVYGESLRRGLEPGGTGIAIVGAVTRKHLVTD